MDPKKGKLPLKTKVAWGAGGFFEQMIANGINVVVMQIFNIGYGIDARLLGFVQFFPRILDAISDPLLGNLTDNTRSRWGRRRPWILVSSTVCSILYVLVWFCNPEWRPSGILWWFTIISILYYQFFGLYSIAYNALGFEQTDDYNERTNLQGYRMLFLNLAVPLLNAVYFFSRHPFFTTDAPAFFSWVTGEIPEAFEAIEIYGIRSVALILGIIMFLFALMPVIFSRENPDAQNQDKIHLWAAIKTTARNRIFLVFVGIMIMALFAIALSGPLIFYLQLYHVCEGDKDMAARLSMIGGFSVLGATIVAIPLTTMVNRWIGKNNALWVGLFLQLTSCLSAWIFFTPSNPWLSLIPGVILVFGMVIYQMGANTILADICDVDELDTGLRREGMYAAALGFVNKLAFSSVNLIAGFILFFCGFDASADEPASSQTILNLRIAYVLIPVVLFSVVAILLKRFPLSHEMMNDVRRKLDERHGRASAE